MLCRTALVALAALLPASLAQISDDFEAGWDTSRWTTYAPDCNQGGTIALDTTVAHSGRASMRVNGAGGYCGHVFFGTTAIPSGDLYVRTWVRALRAFTAAHVTFITMPDTSLGTNRHLRIGGQSNILMFNRESDDATLPDLSPQGIAASAPLPAGEFQCFEYHVGTDGTIETWLNGNAISGLQAGPNANNPYGSQWMRTSYSPRLTGVYFGWESYGGDTNTFWYDDVAISSSRVGCGSTPPVSSTRPSSTGAATTAVSTTSRPASVTTRPATSTTTSRATTTSSAAGPVQT
ncbi:hypothetical protein S7711_06536 [Stachybotrys chartarum IBT 7711]|uniref:Cip1-like core domain-containing protein n=1 Tax=Stachybotrys chartarum (strain CBS 109288 / IBT 7711) TaxID=1280523 RepID=A0A084B2K6_STACB|nr:hypothetical protein S7711_06536 [Stachybotrys chartarum IBT 7711]KFA54655.1 hypothetical protein S40293_02262 [Stachybotrys chartarum IBT 40293]